MAIIQFLFRFQPKPSCQFRGILYLCTLIFSKNHPFTMKKLIAIVICLLFSSVAFSQDNNGFLKRLKNKFVVHDTVYIYTQPQAENDTTANANVDADEEEEVEEDEEFSEDIPVPIDTIDTDDRYRKVVLFDNSTWVFYNIDKPEIPDELSDDHWETDIIHTYRDIALKDLPEEVEIRLVDSLHSYCIPHPGPITSQFKYRWRRAHKGVDIGLDTGDAIYAAFDGVVRVALPSRMTGGYGNVLVIRHVNGLETYYGHLSKYIVKSGDVVKAGELIGYGGSTGRSTGPHLHFETRYMGQSFDPERIFDFYNGKLRDEVFVLKKHYFNINSHYGQTDQQSLNASRKAPIDKSKAKSKAVYYTVRKGDTLSKIAKKHGTTIAKICKLNGIRQNKKLQIGQKLRVK